MKFLRFMYISGFMRKTTLASVFPLTFRRVTARVYPLFRASFINKRLFYRDVEKTRVISTSEGIYKIKKEKRKMKKEREVNAFEKEKVCLFLFSIFQLEFIVTRRGASVEIEKRNFLKKYEREEKEQLRTRLIDSRSLKSTINQ